MVSYDISKVWSFLPTLVQALPATLALMFLTTVLGSAFGLVLTWAQVSEDKVGAGLAKGLCLYFALYPLRLSYSFWSFMDSPQFLNWWLGIDIDHWSKFVFVLVAMFLLFAAMISEVFKAAYLAIPKCQMEAGLSIGLTPAQTIWRIVLPQAFRVALPNMTTAILNLMRDAALAYTIGFIDIMGAGNNLISRNLGNYSLETYTAVAVIYWGIALVISFSAQLLEKRLSVTER